MRYFAPNLLPQNKWFRTRENRQVDDLVLEKVIESLGEEIQSR